MEVVGLCRHRQWAKHPGRRVHTYENNAVDIVYTHSTAEKAKGAQELENVTQSHSGRAVC